MHYVCISAPSDTNVFAGPSTVKITKTSSLFHHRLIKLCFFTKMKRLRIKKLCGLPLLGVALLALSQVCPGYELLGQNVPSQYCLSVTDLYQGERWDKVVPKALLEQVSKDGEIYAVLVGVHRANLL
jgi:hypothetical protein